MCTQSSLLHMSQHLPIFASASVQAGRLAHVQLRILIPTLFSCVSDQSLTQSEHARPLKAHLLSMHLS